MKTSVYRQISEIRRILGDSPDHPQFIELKFKYGWRFIAPVIEKTVVDGMSNTSGNSDSRNHVDASDGRLIFFVENSGNSDRLMSVPVSGGEPVPIDLPLRYVALEDFSTKRNALLLRSMGTDGLKLWSYSISSRELRLLDTQSKDAVWSPDGRALARYDGVSSLEISAGPSD